MKGNKRKIQGITLVSLVITIIILLILAGITIATLTGENGLFARAQRAKIKSQLASAKEEVSLAIAAKISENYDNIDSITPKMVVDEINKKQGNSVYAENESSFQTNIVYPSNSHGIKEKIIVTVNEKLEIVEVKTDTGITENEPNKGNGGSGSGSSNGSSESVNVGKVAVTITDIKARKFTINAKPEDESKIALYQYYINNNLLHEGTEKNYTVTGLEYNTDYDIEVKVIPRTTISIAKLKQRTAEEPVVELANKFDKYIYIDSASGNDTTGDGSNNKPYSTLDKIAESGIIENGYSYGIILREGIYNLTTKMFELNCNKTVNIIGQKQNTILKVNGIYPNGHSNGIQGGKTTYVLNLYRLIWDGDNYNKNNTIDTCTSINLYNVAFINLKTDGWTSYFCPYSSKKDTKHTLNNCTLGLNVKSMLRTTNGEIQLTNCYGGFTSGYDTTDNTWNYKTNYITSTPKVNSTTYEITDDESKWKNVGTGLNTDGSQANLGVYGGEYSWEFESDLF